MAGKSSAGVARLISMEVLDQLTPPPIARRTDEKFRAILRHYRGMVSERAPATPRQSPGGACLVVCSVLAACAARIPTTTSTSPAATSGAAAPHVELGTLGGLRTSRDGLGRAELDLPRRDSSSAAAETAPTPNMPPVTDGDLPRLD